MNEDVHSELMKMGFAPFIAVNAGWESYEDKTLNNGGIRIVICDYVAEVICYSPSYYDIIPTTQVLDVVSQIRIKKQFPEWPTKIQFKRKFELTSN